ncbi:MAG: metal ABC transporter permease [Candidatus Sumerlaeaceae bacterium]|nr:metal ABC transporter permease [Candidatus Sumerlaeaceae bacterium]
MGVIQIFSDMVHYEFWRYAVAGGLIIALVCSVLSVYVVLRRMAFIGQGISHSAFGGVALGIYFFGAGSHATLGIYGTALIFCILVAWLIANTTKEGQISEDSAIGIFLVVSMALGIIFFKAARGYSQDATTYLFGSVLAMTQEELWLIAGLSLIVLLPLWILQKELLFYTFDSRMARVVGVPVNFLHYLLLTLLSITIVISARLIGIVLISAFLVLPAATAQLLCSRFTTLLMSSVVLGVGCTLVGLMLSCATDAPAGAAIVLVQFAVFLGAVAWKRLRQGRRFLAPQS